MEKIIRVYNAIFVVQGLQLLLTLQYLAHQLPHQSFGVLQTRFKLSVLPLQRIHQGNIYEWNHNDTRILITNLLLNYLCTLWTITSSFVYGKEICINKTLAKIQIVCCRIYKALKMKNVQETNFVLHQHIHDNESWVLMKFCKDYIFQNTYKI